MKTSPALSHTLKAVVLFMIAVTFALAQSDRGSISGTVEDSSGAVLPSVTIQAVRADTNVTRTVQSTTTGNFTLPELQPGIYTITASHDGFRKYVRSGVTVEVAQPVTLNIVLTLGSAAEVVEVRGDLSMLKTEDAEISTTVSGAKIDELPLDFSNNIRNPQGFYKLIPGASINTDSSWPTTNQNGLQSFSEEIRIDGASSTNPTPGVFNEVQPSVDALGEFTVQTSNFNAEYGSAGGGAIFNFSIKSGTNKVHGTGYGFLRNEFFNASNRNSEQTPHQRRFDYGGTLGGPLVIRKLYDGHNKTFWFVSEELFRTRDNNNGFYSVPRAEWRNGDFSSLLTGGTDGADILGRPIPVGQLYDPTTQHTVTVGGLNYVVRDPYPGNIIPSSEFNSVAQKILSFVPAATLSGIDTNNLLGITGNPLVDNSILTVKIDHNFSEKNHMSVSENYDWKHKINSTDPFGAANNARDQHIHSHVMRLNDDYSFTPTVLNHFTLGLIRYENPDGVPDRGFDPESELGLNGTLLTGWFPRIQFGLSDFGTAQLKHLYHTVPTLTDAVTISKGAHTYKFGGEIRKVYANFFEGNNGYGLLNFGKQQTALPSSVGTAAYGDMGNAFASFLLGQVNAASLNTPLGTSYRYTDYAFFGQDTFQVNSRLTLSYGLRYDLHRPIWEANDKISSFDPNAPNPGAGNLLGALAFAGSGPGRTGKQSWLDTDKKDLGPRLGIAYKLTDKTVLRGGWGISYGRLEFNAFDPSQTVGAGSVSAQYPAYDASTGTLFNLSSGFPSVDIAPPDLDPTLLNNQGISYFRPESGKLPRIQQWNFTVQRQLARDMTIEAAYVGNKAERLIGGYLLQFNQNDVGVLSMGNVLTQQINNATDAATFGVPYPYPGFTGTVAQAIRPYPQYQGISDPQATVGASNYNALQMKFTQRTSHGLDFLVAYTLSKTLTNVDDALAWGGGGLAPVDTHNLKLQKGLAVDAIEGGRGDRTHNLVMQFGYQLPFAHYTSNKAVKAIADGWKISGVLQYSSGEALPVNFPNDVGSVLFNGNGRYDVVPGVSRTNSSGPFKLNPDAFAKPADFTIGNAARAYGDVRGFPLYNEDLALSRFINFSESKSLEFRMEAFNALNRAIHNNPDTNVADPQQVQNGRALGYGSYFGFANTERQLQLALRYRF